jgi:uncharacterized phage-associated protein
VYHTYKSCGLEYIPPTDTAPLSLTPQELEAIDMVLEYYGEMSGIALVNKTHQEAPWRDAYRPGVMNIQITNEAIYAYFSKALEFGDAD